MIPEVEKKIFKKIDYADSYLLIKKKYTEDSSPVWLYKKSDIIQAFDDLNINVNYLSGGGYEIEQEYKNHMFKYSFVISKNNLNIYLYIYANGNLIEDRVANTGSLLRYLPYNSKLAEELNSGGLVLDSVKKLEDYIKDNLELLSQFVEEYILVVYQMCGF